MDPNLITKNTSSSTVSQANEMPYYDYDNGVRDDTVDDDGDGNKQKSLQKQINERKPLPMLNTMRERRAANIFNENYVTDAQNNGKFISHSSVLFVIFDYVNSKNCTKMRLKNILNSDFGNVHF